MTLPPDPMRPRITAAICAHNESATLGDAITSLIQQSLPPGDLEILIIDNASTDGTAALLSGLGERHPRLTALHEPRLGLAHARNRALASAAAPIVAFIDADAVAEPHWLGGLLAVFNAVPQAGAVGGRVTVQWDHPRPRWWQPPLDEALNRYHPHDTAERLHYPRYPYGTNFAVRQAALDGVGFETALGRSGRGLLAAEEGELCLRIERRGWQVHYAPAAIVAHRTHAARLSRRYILRRAWHHGRSQALLEQLHGLHSPHYPGWPGIVASVARHTLRARLDVPFLKSTLFRMGYRWQRRRPAAGVAPDRRERSAPDADR